MNFDLPEDRKRYLREQVREYKIPPKRKIPPAVKRAMLAQYNAGPRRHAALQGITDAPGAIIRTGESRIDAIQREYVEGRIDIDEFESRVDRALRAAGCPW